MNKNRNLTLNNFKRNNNHSKEAIYIAANNAKEFIYQSSQGILIFKIPLKVDNKVKLSCVIPFFNSEVTIKQAVRSIQNQDMIDIEIILVNDFSSDNTINIINKLANEDPRIKIIKTIKVLNS